MAIFFAGCANTDYYYWGNYEKVIYRALVTPDKANTTELIALLNEDIQLAENKGKPIPPGEHAQLGYVYSVVGNYDAAFSEFDKEYNLYPDSQVFLIGVEVRTKNSLKQNNR